MQYKTITTWALLAILMLSGCAKMDNQAKERRMAVEKFLTLPPDASPQLVRLVQTIRQQEDRYHFLNKVITNDGYALWQHARFARRGRLQPNTAGGDAILIPMALAGTEYVNSFMACKLDDSVHIRLLRGGDYAQYGFANAADSLNAQKVVATCMLLERAAFGHETYTVKDRRLFNHVPGGAIPVRTTVKIKPATGGRVPNGWVTIFFSYQIEVNNELSQVECPPGQACQWTSTETVYENCTFWASGDWPGQSTTFGAEYNPWTWGFDPCNGVPCTPVIASWYYGSPEPPPASYTHLDNWDIPYGDEQKINWWKTFNIDTSGLDSCRKLLFARILTANNLNSIGRIFTKLERSIDEPANIERFQVKYVIKDTTWGIGGFAAADSMYYDTLTKVFKATVAINKKYIDSATDIFIAKTIIHETLHAYLASIAHRIKNGTTSAQIKQMSYDSLFSEYIDTLVARNAGNLNLSQSYDLHHDVMADKLVNKLSDAIKFFANDASITDEYFWGLAWSGLMTSETMNRYYPNFEADAATMIHSYPLNPNPFFPAANDSATNGLRFALTQNRIKMVVNAASDESNCLSNSKGKVPDPAGCY